MRRFAFSLVALAGLGLAACSQQTDDMSDSVCVPAGCNGELCVAAAEASSVSSSCDYKPQYVCYATQGRCEVQANGRCGWTQTAALKRCLANPRAYMEK